MENSNKRTFLFTSESVCKGHPDKMCDQIADAVLDACLTKDKDAKVACETAVKTGTIWIFGEITTTAVIDFQEVARKTVNSIGFDHSDKGFDGNTCGVLVSVQQQSPNIADKVHINKSIEDTGAGDQGMMFGYATDETEEMMPLTHLLASKICQRLEEASKTIPWIRPDGKSQVTVEYEKIGSKIIPKRVHTVVVSVQHAKGVSKEQIQKDLKEEVVLKVIPSNLLDSNTKYLLNSSGEFIIGGPMGDAGVTGRKVVVDGYGGWGGSGGGAFSGKDPTKVDRSASYAARWIAKSLVAAKLCSRCTIQLSYCIGEKEPLSLFVDSYGTGVKSDVELEEIVRKNFGLRPGNFIQDLDLKKPFYSRTSAYGHFGRKDPAFTWEVPKKLNY